MSAGSARLPRQHGEVLDRMAPLSFVWNGAPLTGLAGDSIASALAASGVRMMSRSFKYHRPRGLMTATFHDSGCTFQVGDEPNVRGAHRRLRAGDVVSSQSSWPSLRFDVKAANQLIQRFLGPGFYYKTFIRPTSMWPAYERVLSRFAAGGNAPAPGVRQPRFDKRYAHPDVVVAGGGPAGMAAAIEASRAGCSVLLVEEEHELGGHLRFGGRRDLEVLSRLRSEVAAADQVEVLTDSVVTGRYDDNWLAVVQRSGAWSQERLVKTRAGILVVAAGTIERPYVFAGNDLPGVMLSTAVLRLTGLHAVRPGSRAVVMTANDTGDAAAQRLAEVGVDVVTVVDARRGETIRRAIGRRNLTAVEIDGGPTVDADLLVTATGWTAPTNLANMAGARPVWDANAARFVLDDDLPPTLLAAGGLVGDGTTDDLVRHGREVGLEAARRASGARPGPSPTLPTAAHPALFLGPTPGFVDFSEDVSSKDIDAAAAEGYDSAELAKRFTTASMGPSQGKLEMVNTMAALATATGQGLDAVGTTVWRPPYVPVSIGALAGRRYEPVRRSPMHEWHLANGAAPLVAGQWIRPDHYGDPQREARTVRTAVGIIDVTPLGKLELQGPDVPSLLDQVYVNRFSSLPVGSVRYGVMCAEDGVVLDDGVTGRLGTERWLMTTTSSGAGTVWEWLEQWLQLANPQWQVHVTPVTTAYASINVAGPRSRDLLARLCTDVDLSPDAFGYMRVRSGTVAGVPDCVLWRIGFTGELSFEVHVPASYGLHVWETLLTAGDDLGVGAFGVEAQRILRLEKGHLIVGQDTDGLTKAYSAGLGDLVRLDKADFAGRPELAWQRELAGNHPQLVAVWPDDPDLVPPEASQIVVDGKRIVGRITSSRMSPTLGRSICLAQVAPELTGPGASVTIALPDGRRVAASVQAQLEAVDPEGVRVRG
jgi:sarcosine oxidase, subunit alpha